MASVKFRQKLRQEAEKWHAEGLIDSSVFECLAQRYQFDTLETDSQGRFVLILLGLGGILLGLGVITLVAANWQGWSKAVRVILLLGLFILVNSAGFWGWSSPQPQWQRLGKALLLLGALMLGANLGLMSQMFHQSGAVYQLYWVWGSGVLAMAYGLQITPLAILAILLLGVGYWWAFPSFLDFDRIGDFSLLLHYTPLLAALFFIPLAYWCRSSWVFLWGIVAVVSSFEVTLLQNVPSWFAFSPWLGSLLITATFSLPPLLLWAYPSHFDRSEINFQSIARLLSMFFLAGVSYVFSFRYFWVDFSLTNSNSTQPNFWITFLPVLIFFSLTLYLWWQLGKNNQTPWRLHFHSTLVASGSLLLGLLSGISAVWLTFPDQAFIPTAIYNFLLFFQGIAIIRYSLSHSKRFSFWSGLLLITLQLFSRMVEYQTGLILKSVILFLCGFAILTAGLWFESNINHNK